MFSRLMLILFVSLPMLLPRRTEDWKRLPSELKERANAFRTSCTHLFMLGQKVKMSSFDLFSFETDWEGQARTTVVVNAL